MSLDRISSQLACTDWIPIINIPSGIVHLTCDIRDRIIGRSAELAPQNESLVTLADRLLDDWSHLIKGLLILSVVGSIVLIVEIIWRHQQLRAIEAFEKKGSGMLLINFPDFPHGIFSEKLLDSAEFIKAAVKVNVGLLFTKSSITEVMSEARKDDKNLVLDLIHSDQLSEYAHISTRLQNDPEIALEFMKKDPDKFDQLPDVMKNTVEIIQLVIRNTSRTEEILKKVPDKNVFKTDEQNLLILAVEYGIFKLDDLDPKFCDKPEYAIAALYAEFIRANKASGFNIEDAPFDLLSKARQEDLTVHEAIVNKLSLRRRFIEDRQYVRHDQNRYVDWLRRKAAIVIEQAKENYNVCPTLFHLAHGWYD